MLKTYLSPEIGGVGIDTAFVYNNQAGVGRAVNAVPRSSVFLQTKVPGCEGAAALECAAMTKATLAKDLKLLNVSFVDSVIVHWVPHDAESPTIQYMNCSESTGTCEAVRKQWQELVSFYKAGKARVIGVSNFCHSCLACLEGELSNGIFPMVNQVEYYLGMGPDNHGVQSYAKQRGMAVQAYSVTGNEWYAGSGPSPDILSGNLTTAISSKHGKAPIQVALKWLTDQQMPIMIKTTLPDYMSENLDLFNWQLSADETNRLNQHLVSIPQNPVDVCSATGNATHPEIF
jgi:2,5-diketo-D-gluconate reductase A